MPRSAAPSTHLVARVRAHFGLLHAELGQWLGVSAATVQGIESGRRGLSPAVLTALLPLLPHLPPAESPAAEPAPEPQPEPTPPTAPLPPGTAAPDPRPLDVRRRVCLAQAARLRRAEAGLAARAAAAHHWTLALPALLAHPALAEAAAPPENPAAPLTPEAAAEAAFQAERTAWRRGWATRRAQPLPPAEATRWCLLRARAAALEAEAAALLLQA